MDGPTPQKIRKINLNQSYENQCPSCKEREESIADLKDFMKQQMSVISGQIKVVLEEVTEQKVLIQQLLDSGDYLVPTRKFPLKNEEDLMRLDREIRDGNKISYIKTMNQLLLPAGVVKNLKNIMTDDLTMMYNLDGVLGKKPLKRLPDFYNALLESIPMKNIRGSPEAQLRKAMQLQKKRFIKKNKVKDPLSGRLF